MKQYYLTSLSQLSSYNESLKNDYRILNLTKFNKSGFFDIQDCNFLTVYISFKNFLNQKKNFLLVIFFLELFTFEKPFLIKSKKNNLYLNIRKDFPVGCKVILRKKKLNEFLEKFIYLILESNNNVLYRIPKNYKKKGLNVFNMSILNLDKTLNFSLVHELEQVKFKTNIILNFSNSIWQESLFYLSFLKIPFSDKDKSLIYRNEEIFFLFDRNLTRKQLISFIDKKNFFFGNLIQLLKTKKFLLGLYSNKKFKDVFMLKLSKKSFFFFNNFLFDKKEFSLSGDFYLLSLNLEKDKDRSLFIDLFIKKKEKSIYLYFFIYNGFFFSTKWLKKLDSLIKQNQYDFLMTLLFFRNNFVFSLLNKKRLEQ